MKYWKPPELLRILAEARKVSARNHLVVLFSYKHGLRVTEICNLTLHDVQHGRLDCKRLKGSLHTNRPLESDPNPLLDEKIALAAWLRERGVDDSPFLFTSRINHSARMRYASQRTDADRLSKPATGISRHAVAAIFEDACFRAGIEPGRRNPHAAKHTLGALAYRAGVDTFALQQLLGHRDAKSSSVYAGVTQDEAHAVAKPKMAAIFT